MVFLLEDLFFWKVCFPAKLRENDDSQFHLAHHVIFQMAWRF